MNVPGDRNKLDYVEAELRNMLKEREEEPGGAAAAKAKAKAAAAKERAKGGREQVESSSSPSEEELEGIEDVDEVGISAAERERRRAVVAKRKAAARPGAAVAVSRVDEEVGDEDRVSEVEVTDASGKTVKLRRAEPGAAAPAAAVTAADDRRAGPSLKPKKKYPTLRVRVHREDLAGSEQQMMVVKMRSKNPKEVDKFADHAEKFMRNLAGSSTVTLEGTDDQMEDLKNAVLKKSTEPEFHGVLVKMQKRPVKEDEDEQLAEDYGQVV